MRIHPAIIAMMLAGAAVTLADNAPPLTVRTGVSNGSQRFTITNVSGKAIRAISYKAEGKPLNAESLAVYGLKDGKLFEPGDSREAGVTLSSEPSGFQIDYVYFADGSGWGPDTLNKRAYTAGLVAGARAVLQSN